MDISHMKWRRLNGDLVKQPIKARVEKILLHEQSIGNKLKICIGTDSQRRGNKTEFATVIVFLREKKGGFMLISNFHQPNIDSLKERMILEVSKSVEVAYHLCDLFDLYNVDLEVHADINTDPHFKSHLALKEAMGYILAMGFGFKAKPDAFASSSCADKVI